MTRQDWAAWLLVVFIVLVVLPMARMPDDAYAPQTRLSTAVLQQGTLEPDACQTALYATGATLEWERALYDRCERYAPQTIEALRATVDAQATRLHRTPYGPDPTATARPGWRGWLPMAVRRW